MFVVIRMRMNEGLREQFISPATSDGHANDKSLQSLVPDEQFVRLPDKCPKSGRTSDNRALGQVITTLVETEIPPGPGVVGVAGVAAAVWVPSEVAL